MDVEFELHDGVGLALCLLGIYDALVSHGQCDAQFCAWHSASSHFMHDSKFGMRYFLMIISQIEGKK